jgi:Low-density lipoprotein receptor repeat class B/WD40-like Beta Propeller Repeat
MLLRLMLLRLRRYMGISGLAVAAALLIVSSASAATRPYESSFATSATPQALTVDQSTGDIYVIDPSEGEVERFTATGAPANFTAGPGEGTNALPEIPFESGPSTGGAAAQVAVDNSGGPADGDIYVACINGIRIYGADGALLTTLHGSGTPLGGFGETLGVAVDQSDGDVYVGDFSDSGRGRVWRYTPSTQIPSEADYSGGITTPEDLPPGNLAVDSGHVYVGETYKAGPVREFAAADFTTAATPPEATSTQIAAKATALTVDPSDGDVYVDEGDAVAVFDASGNPLYSFGAGASGTNSAGVGVKAGGDAYVADQAAGEVDGTGEVDVFGPLPTSFPPTIGGVEVSEVGLTTAGVSAEINPGGAESTYRVEYGLADCSVDPCASVPAAGRDIGDGKAPFPIRQQLSGLAPGTTYHFRVSVTNTLGTATSPDQTFTTFSPPTMFEPCPGNSQYRVGPSADLPDCRAYELVSPTDKNGNDMSGKLNQVQAAADGGAITSVVIGGLPGAVGGQDFQNYLSSRVSGGWATSGLLPPQSAGNEASVRGLSPDLSFTLSEASNAANPGAGAALLLRNSSDGSIRTLVPATPGVSEYFFDGASTDGSTILFEAQGAAALTPDAVPGRDNLYAWDRGTGSVSLVGVLPADEGGTAPPEGSYAGSTSNNPGQGGAAGGQYTQNAISADGDLAFFTAADTGQLYVRHDPTSPDASTTRVSASQKTNGGGPGGTDANGSRPAQFQAATPDGSQAFFTSSEELTNDAKTAPEQPVPAIGRADLDGSGVDSGFITPQAASGVVADGTHLYWADPRTGTIGRANLDGSDVEPAFITGAGDPQDVAVDANFIYWTNAADGKDGDGTIARAELDGSAGSVELSFITGASNPQGIAVDGTNVFWVDAGSSNSTHTIGRAALDGSAVNQEFITTGVEVPAGVAVNATNIFWTSNNGPNSFVVQRDLAGTVASEKFIFDGSSNLRDLAVDSQYVYWAREGADAIGRAKLDLSEVEKEFITGTSEPQGLAVDGAHLYWSSDPPVGNSPGTDLYRYETTSGALTDLTPDPVDSNGAEVQGVLGVSDDGSYAYFVANGVLAPGAGPGTCRPRQGGTSGEMQGTCNLYVIHSGKTIFIATLDASNLGDGAGDSTNWDTGAGSAFNVRGRTSRVAPDGMTLMFTSDQQPTSVAGDGVNEIYRYRYGQPGVLCVSCSPNGVGSSDAYLSNIETFFSPASSTIVLTRNLSADGDRIFFDTSAPLMGTDTNGVSDVYEWEADGAGSCDRDDQNGGCLYLLSTGTSSSPSFFADASLSGDDAFIFTRQSLLPVDGDNLVDIYDAGVGGGLASQQGTSSAACSDDACQGAPAGAPGSAPIGSAGLSGPGNIGRCKAHRNVKGAGDKRNPQGCKKHKPKRCKKGKKGKNCKRKGKKGGRTAKTNRGGGK